MSSPGKLDTTLSALIALLPGEPASLLILGAEESASTMDCVAGIFSFSDAAELPDRTMADLGILLSPGTEQTAVIAKARDILCRRVILLEPKPDWTTQALLALGFQRLAGDVETAYLYSPETSNPPREWNNARHWANPENFDRYRW